jgi:hypothetical protein
MPEMLWAVIVRSIDDQKFAISEFRRVLKFIDEHEKRECFFDVTHSGIAKIEPGLREQLIRCILANPVSAAALSTLRLFEELPAREDWMRHLPDVEHSVDLLMTAVGLNLWHQSQEATDCRWVRVMALLLSGKFHVPEEMAQKWLGYPDVGDQRSVRPSIRSAEGAVNPLEPRDLSWPHAFWREAWKNTPCFEFQKGKGTGLEPPDMVVTRARLNQVVALLGAHWQRTHSTTAVDARHDAVFGIAFYTLRLVDELFGISVATGVLGRLGLRTILEAYVSLHYLLSKDEEALWKKWRSYGAGQAKLNALRFDSDMDPPKYINVEVIEQIAGEDIWEEFLTVELGSWSGFDLRRLSEHSGTKDVYDAHYSWTSGYVHSTWGSVRESCFSTCGNPLHRLHRYPDRNELPDTLSEAVALTDLILADVDAAYPQFKDRLLS